MILSPNRNEFKEKSDLSGLCEETTAMETTKILTDTPQPKMILICGIICGNAC
jgi:hypothetical protein